MNKNKKVTTSRETRQISRRWQNVLTSLGEDVVLGDLLKFNQLKVITSWSIILPQRRT